MEAHDPENGRAVEEVVAQLEVPRPKLGALAEATLESGRSRVCGKDREGSADVAQLAQRPRALLGRRRLEAFVQREAVGRKPLIPGIADDFAREKFVERRQGPVQARPVLEDAPGGIRRPLDPEDAPSVGGRAVEAGSGRNP